LRWLVPLVLAVELASSIFLAGQRAFAVLLGAQCVFYGTAVLGYWRKQRNEKAGAFSAPLHFCSMNLALLFGLLRYLGGKQNAVWASTPRAGDALLLSRAAIGDAKSLNR
jgi:hypothetical protein